MSFVVTRDLVGRRVVPHDAWLGSGSTPWVWKYNPGPRGAVILAVYTRPDGAGSVLVFVVEGEEVVLEQSALGGGSAKRTRIDEIVATQCMLIPIRVQCVRCGEQFSSEVADARAHKCEREKPAALACECSASKGAAAIVKERARQLKKWSLEHDAEEHHASRTKLGGLVDAAAALLTYPPPLKRDADSWDASLHEAALEGWRARHEQWIVALGDKHAGDRARLVTIAGALCAAELDRLRGKDQSK